MQLYVGYFQNNHPTCVSVNVIIVIYFYVRCMSENSGLPFWSFFFSCIPSSLLTWKPVGMEEDSSEKHLVRHFFFLILFYLISYYSKN